MSKSHMFNNDNVKSFIANSQNLYSQYHKSKNQLIKQNQNYLYLEMCSNCFMHPQENHLQKHFQLSYQQLKKQIALNFNNLLILKNTQNNQNHNTQNLLNNILKQQQNNKNNNKKNYFRKGAFQITYRGVLIYSKLKSGDFPKVHQISNALTILQKLLPMETNKLSILLKGEALLDKLHDKSISGISKGFKTILTVMKKQSNKNTKRLNLKQLNIKQDNNKIFNKPDQCSKSLQNIAKRKPSNKKSLLQELNQIRNGLTQKKLQKCNKQKYQNQNIRTKSALKYKKRKQELMYDESADIQKIQLQQIEKIEKIQRIKELKEKNKNHNNNNNRIMMSSRPSKQVENQSLQVNASKQSQYSVVVLPNFIEMNQSVKKSNKKAINQKERTIIHRNSNASKVNMEPSQKSHGSTKKPRCKLKEEKVDKYSYLSAQLDIDPPKQESIWGANTYQKRMKSKQQKIRLCTLSSSQDENSQYTEQLQAGEVVPNQKKIRQKKNSCFKADSQQRIDRTRKNCSFNKDKRYCFTNQEQTPQFRTEIFDEQNLVRERAKTQGNDQLLQINFNQRNNSLNKQLSCVNQATSRQQIQNTHKKDKKSSRRSLSNNQPAPRRSSLLMNQNFNIIEDMANSEVRNNFKGQVIISSSFSPKRFTNSQILGKQSISKIRFSSFQKQSHLYTTLSKLKNKNNNLTLFPNQGQQLAKIRPFNHLQNTHISNPYYRDHFTQALNYIIQKFPQYIYKAFNQKQILIPSDANKETYSLYTINLFNPKTKIYQSINITDQLLMAPEIQVKKEEENQEKSSKEQQQQIKQQPNELFNLYYLSPSQNQCWSLLLEKAMATVCDGYLFMPDTKVQDYLCMLTGVPSITFQTQSIKKVQKLIFEGNLLMKQSEEDSESKLISKNSYDRKFRTKVNNSHHHYHHHHHHHRKYKQRKHQKNYEQYPKIAKVLCVNHMQSIFQTVHRQIVQMISLTNPNQIQNKTQQNTQLTKDWMVTLLIQGKPYQMTYQRFNQKYKQIVLWFQGGKQYLRKQFLKTNLTGNMIKLDMKVLNNQIEENKSNLNSQQENRNSYQRAQQAFNQPTKNTIHSFIYFNTNCCNKQKYQIIIYKNSKINQNGKTELQSQLQQQDNSPKIYLRNKLPLKEDQLLPIGKLERVANSMFFEICLKPGEYQCHIKGKFNDKYDYSFVSYSKGNIQFWQKQCEQQQKDEQKDSQKNKQKDSQKDEKQQQKQSQLSQ